MANDGRPAPPQPAGGGGPPAAWRLTFEYDGASVRLVAQQRVAMLAPPDDSEFVERGQAGYWIEVRDSRGRSLYNQILHDPIQQDYEVHSPEPGTTPTRVPVQHPKGVFQAVVPQLRGGTEIVLHGRGSRLELAERKAKQLVKATLRETPPPGGPR